jgi:hypothetical protein
MYQHSTCARCDVYTYKLPIASLLFRCSCRCRCRYVLLPLLPWQLPPRLPLLLPPMLLLLLLPNATHVAIFPFLGKTIHLCRVTSTCTNS